MAREAREWNHLTTRGNRDHPAANVYIPADVLAAALEGAAALMRDPRPIEFDTGGLRYRVTAARTDRYSAKIVIEIRPEDSHPLPIEEVPT